MSDIDAFDLTVPAYASQVSNYGSSTRRAQGDGAFHGALVTAVRPDSPAYDAGIEPGMYDRVAVGGR